MDEPDPRFDSAWRVSSRSHDEPAGPSSILRRIGGPLLLDHALILAGAYLVVLGFVDGVRAYQIVGWVLVAVGVLVEVIVLWWSAGLARRAATRAAQGRGAAPEAVPGIDRIPRWLCVRCGQSAVGPIHACPHCGGPIVRLSSPGGSGDGAKPK